MMESLDTLYKSQNAHPIECNEDSPSRIYSEDEIEKYLSAAMDRYRVNPHSCSDIIMVCGISKPEYHPADNNAPAEEIEVRFDWCPYRQTVSIAENGYHCDSCWCPSVYEFMKEIRKITVKNMEYYNDEDILY